MTDNQNSEALSRLMQKSKLALPYEDFEDRTMLRIGKLKELSQIAFYKKIAVAFFVAGTLLGVVLTSLVYNLKSNVPGLPAGNIFLIGLVAYVLVLLFQVDTLINLFSTSKKRF